MSHAEKLLPIGATEWPPFEYTSPQGGATGADTEIIEEVVRRMGYTPDMKLMPWKRVEALGARGELAGIYSVIKTPERAQLFHFSDPISTSKTVFFKRKSDPIRWQTMEDLSSYRVGIGAGYAYPEPFRAAVKAKIFKSVLETFGDNADLSNLKSLQRGLVDLVICEVSVCSYLIKQAAPELDGLDYSPAVVGDVLPMYLALSKKWPEAQQLTHEFNAALAKFVASGNRRRVFDKFGIVSELK